MYIQLYKFLNWFHSGDDFCPSFLPPEIQNDLTASNETTAVSATDPNLDARLFTFFTGDTQTVVVVGALLPQTRRFLQVWENSEWNFPWFWGWWFFPTSTPKVWFCTQTFKNGWRSRLPDFHGSWPTTCGGTRLLHPHFRFIRQRRFRVVRPHCVGFKALTFGKPRMVAGHVLRPSKRRVT